MALLSGGTIENGQYKNPDNSPVALPEIPSTINSSLLTSSPSFVTQPTPTIANSSGTLASILTGNDTPTPEAGALKNSQNNLEQLLGSLAGKTADQQTAEKATGVTDYTSQLNDINSQILGLKAEGADLQLKANTIPLTEQEKATGRGITSGGLAPLTAGELRKNAIAQNTVTSKALLLSVQADALRGNLASAQRKADQAVALIYEPIMVRINAAKQQIDDNMPFFTVAEQKKAATTKVLLDERSRKIEQEAEDKKTIISWSAAALKNGATPLQAQAISNATDLNSAFRAYAPFSVDPNATAQAIADLEYKRSQTAENLANAKAKGVQNSVNQVIASTSPDDPQYIPKILEASRGGKAVDVTTRNNLSKALTVIGQIDSLEKELKNVDTGPILGILRSNNPYDTKAQLIKAQLTAIIPNLARGVYGEVGVLTDNDIANYTKTLPNLRSTEELSKAILGMTVKTVQRSVENQMELAAGTGLNVSGLVNIYNRVKETADKINTSIGADSVTLKDPKTGQIRTFTGLTKKELEEAKKGGFIQQ